MGGIPKILLVDDEPLNLDYLEQELEDRPVEIITALNGKTALEKVAAQLPDLIFLDIMMPVMDGFEVLRRLKASVEWKDIPVVIISAATDMTSVVKGIELGAEDFLPKPFNPVILHARLNAGLEKKRLRDIEKRYLRSLERDLEIGREIQAGFLPSVLPQPPGWEIDAFFSPAREVSGDYYDVFELDPQHLVLMLGDVTDKGVGSALFMALIRSLLRAVITIETLGGNPPEELRLSPEQRIQQAANMVSRYISTVHDSRLLASLFLGVLNIQTGEMRYLNAGNDPPYLVRKGALFSSLIPTGPLVGVLDSVDYFTKVCQLEHKDQLVIYSDGILDALNPFGEMFEKGRWQSLLVQTAPEGESITQFLSRSVITFIGEAPQYDDISLLVLTRK